MGDLLRQYIKEGDENAQLISEVISQGKILSEDITVTVLHNYLKKVNIFDNILLDGYPRGMKSVEYMSEFLKIDKVIVLNISFEEIKKRVLNRLICPKCQSVYTKLKGVKKCGKCDEELVKRADDSEEVLSTRMEEYQRMTVPVIEYYEKLNMVEFIDTSKDVYKQLDVIINKIN